MVRFSLPSRSRRRFAEHFLTPGGYLTDGRRLIRVVARLTPRSKLVVLEDCLTMNLSVHAIDELDLSALRVVRSLASSELGAYADAQRPRGSVVRRSNQRVCTVETPFTRS